MQNFNSSVPTLNYRSNAKKAWTAPSILGIAQSSDARTGNDSMLIDQAFPAANGSTPSFS